MSQSAKVVSIEKGKDGVRSRSRRDRDRAGLLAALARLMEAGREGATWENLARAWSAAYFSWHSHEVDEFGYDPKFMEKVLPLFEFLYTMWWRVEASGVENVPAEGAGLIVANHSGVLPWDGLMVNLAVRHEHPARRSCRMLALDMFALLPFLAPLLARSGAVRANPENGERLLKKGELVGVFPEGVKGVGKPFKDRYRLARFGRGGFVRLALRTGAPIVPCAIVGAEEIHPKLASMDWLGKPLGLPYLPITPTFPLLGPLGLVPLPSKWLIAFGEPIETASYGPGAAEDPMLVFNLTDQVRETIQQTLYRLLLNRHSVFR